MRQLEVYFTYNRSKRFDPDKVVFSTVPYRSTDGFGNTTEFAELLSEGGAVVNWSAVSFIKLDEERKDDEE